MLGIRFSVFACLLVSVSILEIAGAAHAQPVGGEYPKEVYFDFRGKPPATELTVKPEGVTPFVRSEPEGLRVTLPKDRKNLAPFELIAGGVQGDFEITATIEIVQAETPRVGFGVGVNLFINKVDPPTEGGGVGRLLRPSGAQILFWDQGFGKPGEEMQYDFQEQACSDMQFRLRLQRTGRQLAYFLGAGLKGEEFNALPPKNFGLNDIEKVIVRFTTGKQPHGIDARIIDLRIRSGRAPTTLVAIPEELPRESRPGARWRLWLGAAIVSLLFAGFLCMWLYWRRRNRADKE